MDEKNPSNKNESSSRWLIDSIDKVEIFFSNYVEKRSIYLNEIVIYQGI